MSAPLAEIAAALVRGGASNEAIGETVRCIELARLRERPSARFERFSWADFPGRPPQAREGCQMSAHSDDRTARARNIWVEFRAPTPEEWAEFIRSLYSAGTAPTVNPAPIFDPGPAPAPEGGDNPGPLVQALAAELGRDPQGLLEELKSPRKAAIQKELQYAKRHEWRG